MSAQQPKALRLADTFDHPLPPEWSDMQDAAAELRRLHAENENLRMTLRVEEACSFRTQMQQYAAQRDELLEALKGVIEVADFHQLYGRRTDAARAAIAKAIQS